MAVTLRSLETAVPGTALAQDEVRDVFAAQPGLSRLGARLVAAAFNASAIERRHTALAEWDRSTATEDPVFFDAGTRRILNPSTGARNRVYAREATELYVRAAARALKTYPSRAPGSSPRDRTTGSSAPWAWTRRCSATTWASWAATPPSRPCVRPSRSVRPTPAPWCWWPPPSCAPCTCAPPTTRTPSSGPPSSATAPRRPSSPAGTPTRRARGCDWTTSRRSSPRSGRRRWPGTSATTGSRWCWAPTCRTSSTTTSSRP